MIGLIFLAILTKASTFFFARFFSFPFRLWQILNIQYMRMTLFQFDIYNFFNNKFIIEHFKIYISKSIGWVSIICTNIASILAKCSWRLSHISVFTLLPRTFLFGILWHVQNVVPTLLFWNGIMQAIDRRMNPFYPVNGKGTASYSVNLNIVCSKFSANDFYHMDTGVFSLPLRRCENIQSTSQYNWLLRTIFKIDVPIIKHSMSSNFGIASVCGIIGQMIFFSSWKSIISVRNANYMWIYFWFFLFSFFFR